MSESHQPQSNHSLETRPLLGARQHLGQQNALGKARSARSGSPSPATDAVDPALPGWESQFDFNNVGTSSDRYSVSEQAEESDTESASQVDIYESEQHLKAAEAEADAERSPGTAAENAGQFEIKPEEKIDEETLEILSRNFYQLIRMRLEAQQDRRLNRIAGLSPWADIITFPMMSHSKSSAPKNLQSEFAAIALTVDRNINQLSEELYQYTLSRSLAERSRTGWRYSK